MIRNHIGCASYKKALYYNFEMKTILSDYLNIQSEFNYGSLDKSAKIRRHNKVCEWAEKIYTVFPNVDEVIGFISDHPDISYAKQFILRIIIPCLKKEYREDGTALFSFLFAERKRLKMCDDCLRLFCVTENIDFFDLTDQLIGRKPENKNFLSARLVALDNFLQYSLHELPMGLLCNGDDPINAELSYKLVNEWAELSEKFGKDVSFLKEKYLDLFRAWYGYLSLKQKGNYRGDFESYMNSKNIDWNIFFNT